MRISDLPPDRVDVQSYFDPDKTTPDKIYCTRGGFIPKFDFEPSKYNLNMNQLEDTDVNQTLSLVKVKEAMESAKIDDADEEYRAFAAEWLLDNAVDL